ncbi:MAG: thermonuclease family protein [Myxococcota bacterium]
MQGANGLDIAAEAAIGPDRRVIVLPELPPAPKPPAKAKVPENYDGDTLTLAGPEGFHVRVHGANTTEMKSASGPEPFAEAAKAFTAKLVVGKSVKLHYVGTKTSDSYGRLVAQVETDKGDLAELLIGHGLAHVYVVPDGKDPKELARIERLLAAQARARTAGLGLWSTEPFKDKSLYVTSFHGNGRGPDAENPNVEYFRLANISAKPLALAGWTVTNTAGKKFPLPALTLPAGYTVAVSSGKGKQQLDPSAPLEMFLGSAAEVWNNAGDTMTLRNAQGEVMLTHVYSGQPAPDLSKLPDPVTQTRINKLGDDIPIAWHPPKAVSAAGYVADDGDTIFIPSPKAGVFRANIDGFERAVAIADQQESPPGMLAVRFIGVDAPETHVIAKDKNGEDVAYSQGRPGEIAAAELKKLLAQATRVEVHPDAKRPFDTYSRLLGTVFATFPGSSERVDVNRWIVEQGLGEMSMYYKPGLDLAWFTDYAQASRAAVENKRGIYGKGEGRCTVRPAEFRHFVQGKMTPMPLVIDMESRTVYRASDADKLGIPAYKRLYVFDNMVERAKEELGLTLDSRVKI